MAPSPEPGPRDMTATMPDSCGKPEHRFSPTLPRILQLPRELRDLIYDHYFRLNGGYVYDFEANKLTQDDGTPISLSLVLTCRQIAHEVQGLALGVNPVTFSPFFSDATREDAGLYHLIMQGLTRVKKGLLLGLASQLLTSGMVETASEAYPHCAPIFDSWRSHGDLKIINKIHVNSCGEAPSIWNEFISYVLDLISKHPRFLEVARSLRDFWNPHYGCRALELNDARPQPWIIPDPVELKRLSFIADRTLLQCYSETKYSYSAATAALRFLHSLSDTARMALRKIILREDRESVATPECHGRGFILFCQQNPKLRIERFVSLWKNIFPTTPYRIMQWIFANGKQMDINAVEDDRIPAGRITGAVATWVAEALVLPTLGMPEDSYILVLDGNPTPRHTNELFRVVQRDMTWQSALDTAYVRGLLPEPSWLERRRHRGYMFEGLPEAVANLSTNGSLIRCNFDPGLPYDVEVMLEEHRGWSLQDWDERWATHEPEEYQTESPLPPWHILRWQYVMF